MELRVACTCGKVHSVDQGSAGAAFACACGKSIQVPSLSELRRRAGLEPYNVDPVLLIEHMLADGDLPGKNSCMGCSRQTEETLLVRAECERRWVRGVESRSEKIAYAVLSLFFHFYFFRPTKGQIREYGRDVVLALPVRLCSWCREDFRGARGLKDLLQRLPAYRRLLEKYPGAKLSVLK